MKITLKKIKNFYLNNMKTETLINFLKDRKRRVISENPYKPASVVVPLVLNDYISLLLTKRSLKLNHHKGEISFPGGRTDSKDTTKTDTALRELYEEIGIPKEEVIILGPLDDYVSITNFHISAFLARIPYFCPYSFNKEEVEDIYLIPLKVFLNNPKTEIYKKGELTTINYIYEFNSLKIFGVTAKIIKDLINILEKSGFIKENYDLIF
ncbi:MAG: CoA pyrophosphatase [Proteobacteria bacterium]|nr:CoA pyrophosphatase [Pseudomonadota bacterium]